MNLLSIITAIKKYKSKMSQQPQSNWYKIVNGELVKSNKASGGFQINNHPNNGKSSIVMNERKPKEDKPKEDKPKDETPKVKVKEVKVKSKKKKSSKVQ